MTHTPNQEDVLYQLLKCLLRFGDPPSQGEYCICVHFIRVRCSASRAPPRGETGSAAAFIIITSATTEICYLRLTDAAQTSPPSWGGGIVSEKWDKRGREQMEKGGRVGMCWSACASLCRCVPAHVFLCVKRVFLHISQLCQH